MCFCNHKRNKIVFACLPRLTPEPSFNATLAESLPPKTNFIVEDKIRLLFNSRSFPISCSQILRCCFFLFFKEPQNRTRVRIKSSYWRRLQLTRWHVTRVTYLWFVFGLPGTPTPTTTSNAGGGVLVAVAGQGFDRQCSWGAHIHHALVPLHTKGGTPLTLHCHQETGEVTWLHGVCADKTYEHLLMWRSVWTPPNLLQTVARGRRRNTSVQWTTVITDNVRANFCRKIGSSFHRHPAFVPRGPRPTAVPHPPQHCGVAGEFIWPSAFLRSFIFLFQRVNLKNTNQRQNDQNCNQPKTVPRNKSALLRQLNAFVTWSLRSHLVWRISLDTVSYLRCKLARICIDSVVSKLKFAWKFVYVRAAGVSCMIAMICGLCLSKFLCCRYVSDSANFCFSILKLRLHASMFFSKIANL